MSTALNRKTRRLHEDIALGTIRALKDSGSVLKEQVLAATTLAAVAAIVDTR